MNLYDLRDANVRRCVAVFHPLDAWTTGEWACAMAGEAGEACNVAKKIKRLATNTNTKKDPQTLDECRKLMCKELADTIIYADLLAASLDIDLAQAVVDKFNEVSDRMKCSIKLRAFADTSIGQGEHEEIMREIDH